jgi:hypothetical protein
MSISPASEQMKSGLYRFAVWFLFFLGIALRLKHYFENRSLWLDESWVAIEIVDRSFREILQHQFILYGFSWPPALFLLCEKLAVAIFHNNEFALRLFPLICGIGALSLFYRFTRRYFSRTEGVLALFLFAVSGQLIYYSAELKQYSGDLLSALTLWLLAAQLLVGRLTVKKVAVFTLSGIVFLWFSYPSPFVWITIFCLLVYKAFCDKDKKAGLFLGAAAVIYLTNGLASYSLVVSRLVANDVVKESWHNVLWKGSPWSFAFLKWLWFILVSAMTDPLGLSWPPFLLVLIAVGVFTLWKQDATTAALFLFPIVLTVVAATLNCYPFRGRLLLFLAPAYYLFLIKGASAISRIARRFAPGFFLILFIIILMKPASEAIHLLSQRWSDVPYREIMQFFGSHYQPGDFIYMNTNSQLPFCYYAEQQGISKKFPQRLFDPTKNALSRIIKVGKFAIDPIKIKGQPFARYRYEYLFFNNDGRFHRVGIANESPRFVATRGRTSYQEAGRVWLILSQVSPMEIQPEDAIIQTSFPKRGELLLKLEKLGAQVYLYDFK